MHGVSEFQASLVELGQMKLAVTNKNFKIIIENCKEQKRDVLTGMGTKIFLSFINLNVMVADQDQILVVTTERTSN